MAGLIRILTTILITVVLLLSSQHVKVFHQRGNSLVSLRDLLKHLVCQGMIVFVWMNLLGELFVEFGHALIALHLE